MKTSAALRALNRGVDEVDALLAADPTPPGGLSPKPDVTRALIRAAVVILSSHFERYLRAVCVEAVGVVNEYDIPADRLPEAMRLQHSKVGVDALTERNWDRRAATLPGFLRTEAWLWSDAPSADLDPNRLLAWMKSPKPASVVRAFRLWGIEDIFRRTTRRAHTRGQFRFRLKELVEKRNNIAHGEFTVEATRADIQAYQDAVRVFCGRADAALERTIEVRLGIVRAWNDSDQR